MRNVRVLATDQRMDAKGEDGKAVVQRFSMVTLEATPKIAEKIAVAQTIGQLSLSLRSIADNSAELERAIASGEVKVPQTDDPKAERRMLLAIANQPVRRRIHLHDRIGRLALPAQHRPRQRQREATPDDKIADALTAHGARRVGPCARRRRRQLPRVPPFGSPAAIMSPSFRSEPSKMTKLNIMRRATVGTAIVAVLAASLTPVLPSPALARRPPRAATGRPTRSCCRSGEGEVISLPRRPWPTSWTSNPGVADVNVTSPRQLGLFGKGAGEATVIATAAGRLRRLRSPCPGQPEHQLGRPDAQGRDARRQHLGHPCRPASRC